MSAIFGGVGGGRIATALATGNSSYLPPGMAPQAGPRTPIVPQPDQVRRQNQMLARAGQPGTLASRGAPAAAGATYGGKTLSGAS